MGRGAVPVAGVLLPARVVPLRHAVAAILDRDEFLRPAGCDARARHRPVMAAAPPGPLAAQSAAERAHDRPAGAARPAGTRLRPLHVALPGPCRAVLLGVP